MYFFNHSFTTTVFDADSAVVDDHKSERVCLLLENNCSTDILTPGIDRTSRTIRASTGKLIACSMETCPVFWTGNTRRGFDKGLTITRTEIRRAYIRE